MKRNDVLSYLPHRYPFLMIDKVDHYDLEEKKLLATKNVSRNEPFFNGHFPERALMPGVLIVEALAQAAGILTYLITDSLPHEENWFFLAGTNKVRFKHKVQPADQLKLSVSYLKDKRDIWWFSGTAYLLDEGGEETMVCQAEIMNAKGTLDD